MGIVVSSRKLRPYQSLPINEMDEECGQVSINLRAQPTNTHGVSTREVEGFAKKQWQEVLGRAQQDRYAARGNGQ